MKKSTLRRSLGVLLSLMLLLGLVPLTASAADSTVKDSSFDTLKTAIESAQSGETVNVGGTYNLADTITIPAGVKVQGDVGATTFNVTGKAASVKMSNNSEINGISFIQNDGEKKYHGIIHIDKKISEAAVKNCTFSSTTPFDLTAITNRAIMAEGTDFTIDENVFSGFCQSINVESNGYGTITNNTFSGDLSAILITATTISNLTIEDNTFSGAVCDIVRGGSNTYPDYSADGYKELSSLNTNCLAFSYNKNAAYRASGIVYPKYLIDPGASTQNMTGAGTVSFTPVLSQYDFEHHYEKTVELRLSVSGEIKQSWNITLPLTSTLEAKEVSFDVGTHTVVLELVALDYTVKAAITPNVIIGKTELEIEVTAGGGGTPVSLPAVTPVTGTNDDEIDIDEAEIALTDLSSYADELYTLGLFKGVGEDEDGNPDFALNENLTRIQALILTIRLLGEEEEALAFTGEHPFTDVPDWAAPYVAYGYENAITNGISDDMFGTDDPVTCQQFTTFLLRVLDYSDLDGEFAYDDALDMALEVGLYTDALLELLGDDAFLRGDAAAAMAHALLTEIDDGDGVLLIDLLVEAGLFDQDAADAYIEAIAGIDARLLYVAEDVAPGVDGDEDGEDE